MPATTAFETHITSQGTYLITGGFGGIATAITSWLIAQGARHIALFVRREANFAEQQIFDSYQAKGIQIKVIVVDVSNFSAMQKAFIDCAQELPPIKAVLHTAGVVKDGMLAEQAEEDFIKVMPAKLLGTSILYQLTASMALDFFVLFSSAAALLGSKGQANYAAANSYLDGMAYFAKHEGRVMTSINWGSWAEIGMVNKLKIRDERHRQGILPAQGLQALAQSISSKQPSLAFIEGGIEGLQALYAQEDNSVLLTHLVRDVSRTETPVGEMFQVNLLEQWALLEHRQRKDRLQEKIRTTLLSTMKLPVDTVLLDYENLQNLGMDSLLAVDLRNKLAKWLGKPLPVTLLYDYPSLAKITEALLVVLDWQEPAMEGHKNEGNDSLIDEMDEAAIERALQAYVDEWVD